MPTPPPPNFIQIAAAQNGDGHASLWALDQQGGVWYWQWANAEDRTLGIWRPLEVTRAST